MREILTICGSMRFEREMQDIAYLLETQYGFTILQCIFGNGRVPSENEKNALIDAHMKKIDISDGIYVVDIGGYIGESVQQEISYARKNNKKIYYHSSFLPNRPFRLNPTHLVSVAALVTNGRGEVLLVNSPWRGWEYPGGLIEPGETFLDALHREIREESGVEVEITGFVGICKNIEKDIVNIDFTARYVGGSLTVSDESTEVVWVAPETAMEMVTFPLTKKRLANMLSGKKEGSFFCFKRDPFMLEEDQSFGIGKGK